MANRATGRAARTSTAAKSQSHPAARNLAGQPAGVPRYASAARVRASTIPQRGDGTAESAADRAAGNWRHPEHFDSASSSSASLASTSSSQAEAIARNTTGGKALPDRWQQEAQSRFGIDTDVIRVHDDSAAARLATGFGANAVTVGTNIFFAPNRYAPGSPAGEHLLAHELAHVAQQGGEPRAVQFNLAQTMPVPLGSFDMNMTTVAATATANPGMSGTIRFDPDPNGPYSAEIGLVQAINITDVGGASNPASGMPVNWNNITDVNTGVQGTEAGRMEMMTTGTDGAPAGWYIDSLPSATPRGGQIGPNYIEHFGIGGNNQFGWLRSPTDFGPASLWDFPNMSFDVDFDFETVAKGTDNQTVYGGVDWGFHIRSGAVVGSSEYAQAHGGASSTFTEALERFRGYYVHEPVVLYFDTDQDLPIAGEETKLDDIPDYLARYPDVNVSIDGWADVRGGETHNFDLAQRRADAVDTLLLTLGVDPARIVWSFGMGESDQFSQHGTAAGTAQPIDAGRLRANRRAVVSFEHTVSNHPMVMP